MQIIDKSQESVKLLFTLSENTTIDNPYYLLVIHSPGTNKTYRFIMPENTSVYTERIDKFLIDGEIFKDIEVGQYYYSMYQSETESETETGLGNPVETGLINVTDELPAEDQFISVTSPEADDDFITYKG